jgi:hypothetical protein
MSLAIATTTAIRVSDVDCASLKRALAGTEPAVDWHDACHVTPAGRLALEIGKLHGAACPVGTLLEMITSQGLPEEFRPAPPEERRRPRPKASPDEFRDEWERYKQSIRLWRSSSGGKKVKVHLRELDSVTRGIRAQPTQVREVLWHGRHDLLTAFRALASSGLTPDNVDPRGDELIIAARNVWSILEQEVPAFTQARSDFWIDPDEMRAQRTDRAKGLARRVRTAMLSAFGARDSARTVVYHGFYFYTPLQWAMFRLLGTMPDVRQVFVVHDDGRSPIFESWRHYYTRAVEMPEPTPVTTQPATQSAAARAIEESIRGAPVTDSGPDKLKIRSHGDIANFVSSLTPAEEHYAADVEDVSRRISRLLPEIQAASTPLGALPVGQFIVRLHQCVQPSPDEAGSPRIIISPQLLIDLCASGFLDCGASSQRVLPALKRAMPFFGGCEAAADWVTRADHLRKLLHAEVHPFGGRPDERAEDELEDLSARVANPFRLAGWCDLSPEEAKWVFLFISELAAMLEELFGREQVALKQHFRFIEREVREGLETANKADRTRILERLSGLEGGLDERVSVDAIIDVVQIVLGRETEFDEDSAASEQGQGKDGSGEDGVSPPKPLRDLDALGLVHPTKPIHVSNLSDTAFPGHAPAVPWPFRLERLQGVPKVVQRLFRLREQIAPLGDLYLLWLGLSGCTKGSTLSWISRIDGESRNPSVALTLLLANDRHREGLPGDALHARCGGLKLDRSSERREPTPRPSALQVVSKKKLDTEATKLVAGEAPSLNAIVASHAVACPRRLALQWMLADSASFSERWHLARLYGAMTKTLARRFGESKPTALESAKQTCDDLFRFLTPGERASSAQLATAPNDAWTAFLWGNQGKADQVSRAYISARNGQRPSLDVVAPSQPTPLRVLPAGKASEDPPEEERSDPRPHTCMWCPMASRCLERVRDEW